VVKKIHRESLKHLCTVYIIAYYFYQEYNLFEIWFRHTTLLSAHCCTLHIYIMLLSTYHVTLQIDVHNVYNVHNVHIMLAFA